MSVIAKNDNSCILCVETYFNKLYKLCRNEKLTTQDLKLKNVYFDIKTPFFTDSKSKKLSKMPYSNKILQIKQRKKEVPKNQLEDSEYVDFITNNIDSLITTARNLGYLENSEISPEEWFENNGKARKAALEIMNFENACMDMSSAFTYENSSLCPVIKTFKDYECILPPQSTFHLCDISSFFKTIDKKYDLILIDPPWVNRSVKRKSSYSSLKYEFLRSLPFEKIINPGCLIVVWVTNSSSAASFVTDHLFPRCNVVLTSMWHWCKITKKGQFVYPIDSHHKKPYENLLLGRVQYDNVSSYKPPKEIGSKKVIVSVPSSIHSHKPPLVEVLAPYLKPDAQCLELFARYLLPGWESVGNEVLKLQNLKLFDVVKHNTES